ncbi:hypothetical protein BD769DRAFT_1660754 [Suillus cothurnatus]|nr:hypothetical protein BD769DRAFT_1660754 [Suillus cothurnatus]
MFGREHNHVKILSYKRGMKSTRRSGLPSSRKECDVEEASQAAPTSSKVFREIILVSRSVKPILHAGKGTFKLYPGSTRAGIKVPLLINWTSHDIESWLMVHTAAVNATNGVDTVLFKALTETASLALSGRR